MLSAVEVFWNDGDYQDQEGRISHQTHLPGVRGEIQTPDQWMSSCSQGGLQTSNVQDLSTSAGQGGLSVGKNQGLPEGCSRPVPGAGERQGPHQKDISSAEMYSRMVSQKTVPEDASSSHQDPEDVPSLQREKEVCSDADRVHADPGHDQIQDS